MAKNNRHQIIISNAEKAMLEMEHALTIIEDLDKAFKAIGHEALTEEVSYTLDHDNGQELRF